MHDVASVTKNDVCFYGEMTREDFVGGGKMNETQLFSLQEII